MTNNDVADKLKFLHHNPWNASIHRSEKLMGKMACLLKRWQWRQMITYKFPVDIMVFGVVSSDGDLITTWKKVWKWTKMCTKLSWWVQSGLRLKKLLQDDRRRSQKWPKDNLSYYINPVASKFLWLQSSWLFCTEHDPKRICQVFQDIIKYKKATQFLKQQWTKNYDLRRNSVDKFKSFVKSNDSSFNCKRDPVISN